MFVKERIGALELNEPEIGVEAVSEVSECVTAHACETTIPLNRLFLRKVSRWVDPIAADFVPNVTQQSVGVTRRVLRRGVARQYRAVDFTWRVCDGRVDDDARQAVLVQQFPERVLADATGVHNVPIVTVEVEKAEHAVFSRVDTRVQRGPRARGPRWELRFQWPGRPVLENRSEVRKRSLLEQRFENAFAPRVDSDEESLHLTVHAVCANPPFVLCYASGSGRVERSYFSDSSPDGPRAVHAMHYRVLQSSTHRLDTKYTVFPLQ